MILVFRYLFVLWNQSTKSNLNILSGLHSNNSHLFLQNHLFNHGVSTLTGSQHTSLIGKDERGMLNIMIDFQIGAWLEPHQSHSYPVEFLDMSHLIGGDNHFFVCEWVKVTNLLSV